MHADSLRVQTSALHAAAGRLGEVVAALNRAGGLAEPGADVVAHDGLRSQLREVGDGWTARRQELIDELTDLGSAARLAGESYERIEAGLAGALVGPP